MAEKRGGEIYNGLNKGTALYYAAGVVVGKPCVGKTTTTTTTMTKALPTT